MIRVCWWILLVFVCSACGEGMVTGETPVSADASSPAESDVPIPVSLVWPNAADEQVSREEWAEAGAAHLRIDLNTRKTVIRPWMGNEFETVGFFLVYNQTSGPAVLNDLLFLFEAREMAPDGPHDLSPSQVVDRCRVVQWPKGGKPHPLSPELPLAQVGVEFQALGLSTEPGAREPFEIQCVFRRGLYPAQLRVLVPIGGGRARTRGLSVSGYMRWRDVPIVEIPASETPSVP